MKYRSAQGKIVDMSVLAAKNERTRAVGNMKVNARGDTIDSYGKIITPVTEKVAEKYQKTVGNKQANARRVPTAPLSSRRAMAPVNNTKQEELTEEERNLNELLEDDVEVENIKAKENKK